MGFITLIITGLLTFVALRSANNQPLSFAKIGTQFALRDHAGTRGYDGQFAYYIARDGANAVPYIDGPSLRYQRILYPLLARLLALANPDIVPWTLIIVNILAHSVGAALLAYLLTSLGASPWGALIYSLWLGEIFAFRLDLNEPLCMAFGLGAIVLYYHKRFMGVIVLLVLAVMTKEFGIIIAAGLALHLWFSGKRKWAVLFMVAPILTFLVWWGIMRLWFGTFPTIYPAARIHWIPLQGMFSEDNPLELLFLVIWLGIPTVIVCILALRTIWRKHALTMGAALALAGVGWVFIMPDVSWQDPVAAYRVALPLIVTTILFVGQHYPRRLSWLAALWLPSLLVALMTPTLWFVGG